MSVKKNIALITFAILISLGLNAQQWESFQSEGQINDLEESSSELFMATNKGLVVMNKTTLEKSFFNKSNSNLNFNHIEAITKGPAGDTWIGTYDMRLAQFDGTDFQTEIIPQGTFDPGTIRLYDLEIAPNGDIWVGTNAGVFHRQGTTWTQYQAADLGIVFFDVWDIEFNAAGDVFFGSSEVHKFSGGVWEDISATGGSTMSSYINVELFLSSTGDLFYLGDLDQVGYYDGTTWTEFDIGTDFSQAFNGSQAIGFSEDADGDIYLNTENHGIFKFTGSSWVQESGPQVNAFRNKTSYLHIGNDGKRWLNNNIHLSVDDNGTIRNTIISEQTIEFDNIENIRKGMDGTMYFVTISDRNIAVKATDDTWSSLALPTLQSFEDVRDIMYLASDDIYLGTNVGLYYYNGSNWSYESIGSVEGFVTNSLGQVVFRTNSRIRVMEDGLLLTEYTSQNSPLASNLLILSHGVDANDNIWIGSSSWDGSSVIQMMTPSGVWTDYDVMDYPAIDRAVGNFHFDTNDNLWVPSGIGGVISFDGLSWTNPVIDNAASLMNTNVYDVESDASGKVYFSHEYGVTTLSNNGVWEELPIADVPNVISSETSTLEMADDGTLWWGSSVYGVFAYAGLINANESAEIKPAINFAVYPNPAVDYTIIDFVLEEKSNVDISIYNNLGQLISNNNLGELYEGTFQERIELNQLPSGSYLIQLRINHSFSTKKIIIR